MMENKEEQTHNKIIVPKKKLKMTQEEAFELIQEWAEYMEVKLSDDDLDEVKQELWMAVTKERLTFDESEEIFKYVLKKPIKDIHEKNVMYSILYLKESQMKDKKGMSKTKSDIDTAVQMYRSYCTDTEGNKIEVGFLERLYDRDMQNINAIILGFFVQAVPGPIAQK